MDNWIQDLGVVGVLSVALMFILRYLTQTLSWEVKNIHDIVVKLIDKINNLKEAIDRLFNRNGR